MSAGLQAQQTVGHGPRQAHNDHPTLAAASTASGPAEATEEEGLPGWSGSTWPAKNSRDSKLKQ
eukprot:11698086-Alexandrium_andersonii.AAC.1